MSTPAIERAKAVKLPAYLDGMPDHMRLNSSDLAGVLGIGIAALHMRVKTGTVPQADYITFTPHGHSKFHWELGTVRRWLRSIKAGTGRDGSPG